MCVVVVLPCVCCKFFNMCCNLTMCAAVLQYVDHFSMFVTTFLCLLPFFNVCCHSSMLVAIFQFVSPFTSAHRHSSMCFAIHQRGYISSSFTVSRFLNTCRHSAVCVANSSMCVANSLLSVVTFSVWVAILQNRSQFFHVCHHSLMCVVLLYYVCMTLRCLFCLFVPLFCCFVGVFLNLFLLV